MVNLLLGLPGPYGILNSFALVWRGSAHYSPVLSRHCSDMARAGGIRSDSAALRVGGGC
jgi:hypothetical protein